ncbi:MAG: RsmE family RNA methyltransferase, partial [Candidatus Cloacimonetes bacterium]|nr:RsmE family RNA methyltransferase [Candidatus Cloacimonadota bacterium]
ISLINKRFVPIVASEIEQANLLSDLVNNSNENFCLLIGPEGGFDKSEFSFFQNEGVRTFSLGNHVLRAETAAIAAVSQIMLTVLNNNRNYY